VTETTKKTKNKPRFDKLSTALRKNLQRRKKKSTTVSS